MSKAPATAHGFKDATIDPDLIRSWWRNNPNYNIGIACGTSGLAVIDIDPRNGGEESLVQLAREHGPLPVTPISLTGGGGTHYLFKAPKGVKLSPKLAEGIDLKAEGGYIIAPPSVHPDTGRQYLWDAGAHPDDIPLAELPAWIAGLAQQALKDLRPQTLRHDGPAPGWLGLVYDAIVSNIEAQGGRLRPSGNGGLVGRCPLHHDRHPSFSIHPEKGWKCFSGCGEGRLTNLAMRLGISII